MAVEHPYEQTSTSDTLAFLNGQPGDPSASSTDISIRAAIGILRRHLVMVVGMTAIALVATACIIVLQTPIYHATATIRIVDARRAIAGEMAEVPVVERRGSTVDPIYSQISLIRSRGVVGQVVDDLALRLRSKDAELLRALVNVQIADDAAAVPIELRFASTQMVARSPTSRVISRYGEPIEIDGVRFSVMEPPSVKRGELTVIAREEAIDKVLSNLQVRPRELTDVVELTYSAPDPATAQRVVNAIVQTFQVMNTDRSRKQSQRRRIFLEQQMAQNDSIQAELQAKLAEFRQQKRIYSSRGRLEAQQSGLLDLELREEELRADRRIYASLLAGLSQNRSAAEQMRVLSSSAGIITNPVIMQFYSQLVQYQTERDSLTTGTWAAAPTHPDVQRLTALINTTEEKLASAIQGHISYLDERIAALEGVQSRSESSLQLLVEAEAEEVYLAQQLEPIREMGNHLRQEYQKARIAEAVDVGQLEVIDLAALPYSRANGAFTLKLAIGLLLGLALGAGSAFLREAVNTSIHRRNDLETVVRAPTLAVVPRMSKRIGSGGNRLPSRQLGTSTGGAVESSTEMTDLTDLVTLNDPRSSWAESYRMLRTGLLFAQDGHAVKSIVVTSAAPQEGKTTTAANLAVTLAREGLKVLIVDCDLRRARLHKLFRTGKSPGLAQVVQDQISLEDAIRATPIPGLSILPAGLLPPGPTDLLTGRKMRALLDRLTSEYDRIVLDAPPVLALADAAILGGMADGVLLVVRAGKTERTATEQAYRQLALVGAKLVGAVLNDPDARVSQREDYYYLYDYSSTDE